MSNRKSSVKGNDLFPREIDIEICLKTLRIYQKLEGDVNCVVWDASLVLAKYLETMCQCKSDFLSNLRVLELGSGLGVVGLTAAILGAQVTITDLPEALPLLRLNISENKYKIGSMGGYATAESLIWGDENSSLLQEEFDIVVLADCVYYEEPFTWLNFSKLIYSVLEWLMGLFCDYLAIDPLIYTLKNLNSLSIMKPIIYLTQELRATDTQKEIWKSFFVKLLNLFNVEKIPEEKQHANYRSPDIVLLKIAKK